MNRIHDQTRLAGGALLALALLLAGCGGLAEGSLIDRSFWANSPFHENEEAELGLAALAKGDYPAAEAHFDKALKSNPKDSDALLGAGILYQNTGQPTRAREMYEALLASRPDPSRTFVGWGASCRPVRLARWRAPT